MVLPYIVRSTTHKSKNKTKAASQKSAIIKPPLGIVNKLTIYTHLYLIPIHYIYTLYLYLISIYTLYLYTLYL